MGNQYGFNHMLKSELDCYLTCAEPGCDFCEELIPELERRDAIKQLGGFWPAPDFRTWQAWKDAP